MRANGTTGKVGAGDRGCRVVARAGQSRMSRDTICAAAVLWQRVVQQAHRGPSCDSSDSILRNPIVVNTPLSRTQHVHVHVRMCTDEAARQSGK